MTVARRHSGASPALVLAAVLGSCVLAGAPLYMSSAGSAAIQGLLAETCASDAGLRLPLLSAAPGVVEPALALLDGVDHVADPVVEATTRIRIVRDGAPPMRAVLVARTDAERHVEPPIEPVPVGEGATSATNLRLIGIDVGDRIRTVDFVADPNDPDAAIVDLTISESFDDVPVRPEPSYWCGDRQMLRPSSLGDPPPPWIIVDPTTLYANAGRAFRPPSSEIEFRVEGDDLTRTDVREIVAAFDHAVEQHDIEVLLEQSSQLPTLLVRADALADAVGAAASGVRLAGLGAATLVLVAAAGMLARERRRELRLLALRGETLPRMARSVVTAVAAPVAVGTAIGAVGTLVAVRALGPAPQLEPIALRAAGVAVVLGMLGAIAVGTAVATLAGDRFVDASPRRHLWRLVPFELLAVGLAVVSYRRLADGGGLKMFGAYARRGDLLAQAFPVFALAACVAVLWRPARWLIGRLRTSGTHLPRGPRLGWRRVVLDPSATVLVAAATFLATGSCTAAAVLSESARQQLADKADTFVGADLAVSLVNRIEVPPWLEGRATVVLQSDAGVGDVAVDVLGVDADELLDVSSLRPDAADESLAELVRALDGDGGDGTPAVFVAAPDEWSTVDLEGSGVSELFPVTREATAAFFPGARSGRPLIVVDRDALDDSGLRVRSTLWVSDPPPGTVEQLRAGGSRVGAVVVADQVFNTSSYKAQGWALAPFVALGVLFGAVAIAVQLLVVEARRDTRRSALVLMQRMGFRRRSLWAAAFVEIAVPLWLAGTAGVAAAIGVSSIAVRELDPLPLLPPPARLVVPGDVLWQLALAIALTTVALTALVVRSSSSADPMKVMRGTV